MIFFSLILTALLLGGPVFWLWLREKDRALKPFFFPALLLKISCGIGVGLLYFYYYSYGDTYGFQKQSEILTEFAKTSPVPYLKILFWSDFTDENLRLMLNITPYTKAVGLLKILSLLNFITDSNYYLNGLYFSFFSFAGSWFLVRTLSNVFPITRPAAILAFLFFPTVVFWTSGVLKEALLMGAVCALVALFIRFSYGTYRYLILELVLAICAMVLIWDIKFYVGGVLFPVMFAWLLVRWLKQKVEILQLAYAQVVAFFLVLVLGVVAIMPFHPLLSHTDYLLNEMVNIYNFLSEKSPETTLQYDNLEPSFSSFARYAPLAAFNTIYRPFIGEGHGLIWWLQGLENLFIAILTILFLASAFIKKRPFFTLLFVALLVYCLVLATMFGLSTPNLGTLSRYRVIFLPFLVYILLQNEFFYRFSAKFSKNS